MSDSKGIKQLEAYIGFLNNTRLPENIDKFSEYQQGNILASVQERKNISRDLKEIFNILKSELKTEPLVMK